MFIEHGNLFEDATKRNENGASTKGRTLIIFEYCVVISVWIIN